MSAETDALTAQVASTDGVIDSVITLLEGLAAIFTGVAGDKAATLAAVADLKTKTDALSAAVAAIPPTP